MKTFRITDFRTLPFILALFAISLIVISSATAHDTVTFTRETKSQLQFAVLGLIVYGLMARFDYRKLKQWTPALFGIMIILLLGLFFTDPIQNVRRWYRFSFLPFAIQPSEIAKLIVVIVLATFLDDKRPLALVLFAALVPMALIYKQPDLGSALLIYPITLVMLYFANSNPLVVRTLSGLGLIALSFVVAMFLGFISHESVKPYVLTVLKDYQYERLNPNTYHQTAAQTAIALGQITGTGVTKSEFTGKGWLPFAHTDSVFPAFIEQFGLFGGYLLLLIYFGLIYFSFQVVAVAKDSFGRVLAAGVSIYLASHVIVNMGMMCGLLPITGVPLVLITYGGSSILSTMLALGLLQSIYTRRYMF